MNRDNLLRELRKPYRCFARLHRAHYDGATVASADFLLHKGCAIETVREAMPTAIFAVEIKRNVFVRTPKDTITFTSLGVVS